MLTAAEEQAAHVLLPRGLKHIQTVGLVLFHAALNKDNGNLVRVERTWFGFDQFVDSTLKSVICDSCESPEKNTFFITDLSQREHLPGTRTFDCGSFMRFGIMFSA